MIQLKKLPADLRRGRRSRFLSEPLEPRRLLSQYFAYVQLYSPLETTSGSNAISVAPGQSVTFNVSVIGEAFGGAGGPTCSGTVSLFETNTAGTVNQL